MESLQARPRCALGGLVVLAFRLPFRCLLPFAAVSIGLVILIPFPGLFWMPPFFVFEQITNPFTICLAVYYSRFSETLTPFRSYFQLSKRPRTHWRCGGFLFTQSDALVRT